jgi:hypothetical protein
MHRQDGAPGARAFRRMQHTQQTPQAHELTMIISTSASRFGAHEQMEQLCLVLDSLQQLAPDCRKVLVFDALPKPGEVGHLPEADREKWQEAWTRANAYREYCAMLWTTPDRWKGLSMRRIQAFGHLIGTVREALAVVTTPWAFITQHDLVTDAAIVGHEWLGIREALATGAANYIQCGRDSHASFRSRNHWRFVPELDRCFSHATCHLTAAVGFSDQSHFVNVDWV